MGQLQAFPEAAVFLKDGHPVTTSLYVAEVFGKQHKDVLKAISNLDCSEEFNRRNFAPIEYIDERSRKQPMYEITKDGLVFLIMGFNGAEAAKYKEAYIKRFNAMEEALRAPAPLRVINVPSEEYWRMRAELAEMKLENRTRKNADDSEEGQIIALHQAGYGPTEIGRQVGRTSSGVESIVKRLRKEGRL